MMEYKEVNELILNKEYDKIKELINSDAKYLELEDEYDDSRLLFKFAGIGEIDMLKFLLEKGANINHVQKNKETALYNARKNIEAFKYLLDNGADINIINPVYNFNVIYDLYESNKRENLFNDKELDDLMILIMDKLNVIASGIFPILNKNKIDLFKYAMKLGKVSRNAILSYVSAYNKSLKVEVLEYLLDNKYIDVNGKNTDGYTLFVLLLYYTSDMSIPKLLVEKGVDLSLDNNGAKALLIMASKANLEGVKYFLKLGIDINSIDETNNQNALHQESSFYDPENIKLYNSKDTKPSKTLEYLVDNGIDITHRDFRGKLPIHRLSYRKQKPAVKYLFERTINAIFKKDISNNEKLEYLFSMQEIAGAKKEKDLLINAFSKFPKESSRFCNCLYENKTRLREIAVKTLIKIDDNENLEALRSRAETESNKSLLKVLNEYLEGK